MADDDRDFSNGMMSETYYPMNHVPWGCGSGHNSPVVYVDKETQFSGVFVDRSTCTSVVDLNAARGVDPSGDSGFGEHALLAPAESSSCVTEDASHGGDKASHGAIYSEIGSTPSPELACDRDQFCLEDEILHVAEEPLTAEGEDERGVIASQHDVPRLDHVDGPTSAHDLEDNCAVDCLYYTLKCCDCRII